MKGICQAHDCFVHEVQLPFVCFPHCPHLVCTCSTFKSFDVAHVICCPSMRFPLDNVLQFRPFEKDRQTLQYTQCCLHVGRCARMIPYIEAEVAVEAENAPDPLEANLHHVIVSCLHDCWQSLCSSKGERIRKALDCRSPAAVIPDLVVGWNLQALQQQVLCPWLLASHAGQLLEILDDNLRTTVNPSTIFWEVVRVCPDHVTARECPSSRGGRQRANVLIAGTLLQGLQGLRDQSIRCQHIHA
mmetsp:Transcript_10386/g.18984  ORF Transcript_10386/g.18984 Transcript_10386/m.18984 type:complete len:244 (+) Transcript_10386:139-870(+)